MDSREKVNTVIQGVGSIAPSDEETARLLSIFSGIAPMVAGYLPDEAEKLDEWLLTGAAWALRLRSDEAPPALETSVALAESCELPVPQDPTQPAPGDSAGETASTSSTDTPAETSSTETPPSSSEPASPGPAPTSTDTPPASPTTGSPGAPAASPAPPPAEGEGGRG